MNFYQDVATLFLRLGLASGFLSAVASRASFWGKHSSGWSGFLEYTAQVNSFAPKQHTRHCDCEYDFRNLIRTFVACWL